MLLLSCRGGVCGGVRPARPEGHGRPAGRSRGWRGRRSGGAAAADTAGEALPRTGPADWRLGRLSQRPDSLSPPPRTRTRTQTRATRRSRARPSRPADADEAGGDHTRPAEPHAPAARPPVRRGPPDRTPQHGQDGHSPPNRTHRPQGPYQTRPTGPHTDSQGAARRALSVGRGARGQARRGRVEVRATSSGGRTMRWWWCAAGAVVSSMRSSAAMRPMRRAGRRTEVRGTAAAAANSMSS